MRKEEIRHDPVREKIINAVDFLKNNQNKVIILLLIFIFLIGGISFYKSINNLKSDNASNIAGLAQNTFINGNYDEASVKFDRVVNDYPGTSGALQSLVYLLNNAIKDNDYTLALEIVTKHKGNINNISDPIVKSYLYKVQGDISLSEGNVDDALFYYTKANEISVNINFQIKYNLDISSIFLVKKQYGKAIKLLNKILEIEDIGFNEKNKAEELLAFANNKLGT